MLFETYKATDREIAVHQCNRAPHSMDFLLAIPIEGLGQRMQPRLFRSVLRYRLSIPMFIDHEICPTCSLKKMDIWGDHAIHCRNDIGAKYRHNLVRDVLADICNKSGVVAKKEVSVGLSSDTGKDLRPADLLIYNWDKGKDMCLDVIGVSPFTGSGVCSFVPGIAITNAVAKKRKKYESKCALSGYSFSTFAFTTFGELGADALVFLSRVTQAAQSLATSSKVGAFIYHRIGFALNKGVGAQLVVRLPTNFM
ncbi:hypothetical protein ACHQM5_019103 [Ranunculus cassubicifolius]